jgi:hypothetical protein
MTSRAQVTALLDGGHSYETAARQLKISAGLAYMIATGRPADGSGAPATADLSGSPPASPQRLSGPPPLQPIRDAVVIGWVQRRAARDLTPPR